MDLENGYSTVHVMIALCFGLIVALGSYTGTSALTSLDESEMSEVTGQEGIEMDLHLGGDLTINEVNYFDDDGHSAGSGSAGVVGLHNIQSTAASSATVAFEGITLDADAGVTVNGNSTEAIVIGIPTITEGLKVTDIAPAADVPTTTGWSAAPSPGTNSMGGIAIGGVDMGETRLEISGN